VQLFTQTVLVARESNQTFSSQQILVPATIPSFTAPQQQVAPSAHKQLYYSEEFGQNNMLGGFQH